MQQQITKTPCETLLRRILYVPLCQQVNPLSFQCMLLEYYYIFVCPLKIYSFIVLTIL